ncbi:interferon-induced GTP-binding protein Mx2 [Poronia punctata]|nr:interferon-induced GTP-binding protein Mx2 [Poronia punctata]
MVANSGGLGNQSLLNKIDKLRELNVGSIIPLPQLVVVGDQSSGKSSVLESLTGFAFPRAAGLCTRYATQITCRRDGRDFVTISIIPRPNADDDLKARLQGFHRELTHLGNDKLAEVFHEANKAMGVRMEDDEADSTHRGAFSEDILKIEISGPGQPHLTVIDVPGIFRVATPGLTTESDVLMVRNMVKGYMHDRRTIILAVIPCNVDIATQEILKLAKEADPNGVRTMGVLTKPDLATENATKDAVISLLLGKRNALKLGYCVVKNRSADDQTSTLAERLADEKAFFMSPPWPSVADRCGTTQLQGILQRLLMDISKHEFPHVKSDIDRRLRQSRESLENMGASRSDRYSQRRFLGNIADKFHKVTQCALNGYYADDDVFSTMPELKISTRIMELNEMFSNNILEKGHKHSFSMRLSETPDVAFASSSSHSSPNHESSYIDVPAELDDIIVSNDYECPDPQEGDESIEELVKEIYRTSRGPEIGTFNGTILTSAFRAQSEKWEPLTLEHCSRAVCSVHMYISRLLAHLCPEEQVRDQLWEDILVEKLCAAYRGAMDHARFLLDIERKGRLSTFNHYFNSNLQNKRAERVAGSLGKLSFLGHEVHNNRNTSMVVRVDDLKKHAAINKDNVQQVCEDIVDALMSYYKVSRKRFVDSICQQVVNHFLMDYDASPLKILCSDLIMGLNDDQLEMIAGEDAATKDQRQFLQREVEALEAAHKVLRGN